LAWASKRKISTLIILLVGSREAFRSTRCTGSIQVLRNDRRKLFVNANVSWDVSNTLSGTISSYRIGDDGTLTLINGTAADTGPMSAPRDLALSNNSRFLYVQIGGGTAVASFRVGHVGALTPLETDGGLPFGTQGIAAR
jgi:6-phosphogluconolactonase (cycloisomerase 2 family)